MIFLKCINEVIVPKFIRKFHVGLKNLIGIFCIYPCAQMILGSVVPTPALVEMLHINAPHLHT